MAEGDTLVDALIGGVVSIVLSFTALSPILGGAVAGYLQGGDRGAEIRVGAYAGLVAAVTIGLSALGGWLGNYVKYDTDVLE